MSCVRASKPLRGRQRAEMMSPAGTGGLFHAQGSRPLREVRMEVRFGLSLPPFPQGAAEMTRAEKDSAGNSTMDWQCLKGSFGCGTTTEPPREITHSAMRRSASTGFAFLSDAGDAGGSYDSKSLATCSAESDTRAVKRHAKRKPQGAAEKSRMSWLSARKDRKTHRPGPVFLHRAKALISLK
jgi:hypothetical protein